ncbi:cupin domain-containing protein [Rhodobacteraceae bacterium B1Z28]|uniref:Cupin domain-containing protein n=1 Tax=Ruegeria haliotis TaxID=2747601 RepID=A0ABX2PUL5_9RHOB|nr:cupin domain-containing protein [Ruegeria haliotis]NVO57867.1 cupin domain-containing protein [Ruegeria haliotis]
MKPLLLSALILAASPVIARDTYPPVEVLLQTETSVIGEPLEYPEGTPQITMAIVTMKPGQKTGWHRHEAPLAAYILEGEITVDYGDVGRKTYNEGDALIEAFRSPHAGENTGDGIVRILAVFAGADGVSNTVTDE